MKVPCLPAIVIFHSVSRRGIDSSDSIEIECRCLTLGDYRNAEGTSSRLLELVEVKITPAGDIRIKLYTGCPVTA